MEFETIKGCGDLGIEFKGIEGSGSRVSRDFLSKLIRRIVERATQYYDQTEEHVFNYRERQLHSVVCPSIADLTSSYLIEHPLTRKPTGDAEYRGNVDYWVCYRGYSFLIELKHTYFAYKRASKPRRTVNRKFLRALKQLGNIRKAECRNLTIGKGLIKVAIETVVFYRSSKEKAKLESDLEKQDFSELLQEMVENAGLANRLNLLAIWLLDEELIEPVACEKTFEIYPAVAFIGSVSEIIE